MCGISGYINLQSQMDSIRYENLQDLKQAIAVQRHRGPDDTGVCGFCFQNQRAYPAIDPLELQSISGLNGVLGFNRLSIKDLSVAGHQPMLSDDQKILLVFNGEIYNDDFLRKELIAKGHHFKGTSDTEVILRMILEYGFETAIGQLNGMFAICAVNLHTGTISMARDRFGIKPFYYSIANNKLIFASELKTMIQFRDLKRELDLTAMHARMIFSRPGHDVLLKNVELVKPGHILHIKFDGSITEKQYFDVNNYTRLHRYKNLDEAIEAAESVLADAVSRQMVSDVKVGCQLSGGIDATLVTYFANRLSTDNLNDTVSIIDENGAIGEEEYIDYVSQKLKFHSHKFILSEEYFLNNYERMIWYNDAPVYRPYFVCFMHLAEQAKKYVTVLLSGEGSDETTGGYSRFAAGVYYPFIAKMGGSPSLKKYNSYAEYAAMSGDTITGLLNMDSQITDELIQRRLNLFDSFQGTDFTKHLKFEMAECLPEALLRQDKMTMASSIENRVPLLDNEVVDFVMQLPEEYLLRFVSQSPVGLSSNPLEWVQGKFIFKEIVAKHFGHDFAYRKKMIMALDEKRMLSSPAFVNYYNDIILPGMKQRGLLDANQVDMWFKNIKSISHKEYLMMWRAITMETWCKMFLDGAYKG